MAGVETEQLDGLDLPLYGAAFLRTDGQNLLRTGEADSAGQGQAGKNGC
jgi:hypothetical protein